MSYYHSEPDNDSPFLFPVTETLSRDIGKGCRRMITFRHSLLWGIHTPFIKVDTFPLAYAFSNFSTLTNFTHSTKRSVAAAISSEVGYVGAIRILLSFGSMP